MRDELARRITHMHARILFNMKNKMPFNMSYLRENQLSSVMIELPNEDRISLESLVRR